MIRIYGGDYRGDCRKERMEQIDCISWLKHNHPDRWPLIFHPSNETRGTASHMQMRAKEGVSAGVSDIIDFGAIRGAFELKRADKTKCSVSKEQRAFLQAVADTGGFAAICYGFGEFKKAYEEFLIFLEE